MIYLQHGYMEYRMKSRYLGGKANQQATGPTHSIVSKGPIYREISLPLLPNLITPSMGDTLRRH